MFLVVASRLTDTNFALLVALGRRGIAAAVLPPAQAAREANEGDVALARLDVLPTLDGVEAGLWEIRRLEHAGVRVLNPHGALLASHDKLATALALAREGVPHPSTAHVGGAELVPELEPPVVVKPRFGSWGRDVVRCESRRELRLTLDRLSSRGWFARHGALVQELVPSRGLRPAARRRCGDRSSAPSSAGRLPANGARTSVSGGGGGRRSPPPEACALALAAADAVGADLVGVDLVERPDGGWIVLELNGAVDFTDDYALGGRRPVRRGGAAAGARGPRAPPPRSRPSRARSRNGRGARDPARPDGVRQAVRQDRGEDHERRDVEHERAVGRRRVEDEQREQHRRDALRPEPGDERLLRRTASGRRRTRPRRRPAARRGARMR